MGEAKIFLKHGETNPLHYTSAPTDFYWIIRISVWKSGLQIIAEGNAGISRHTIGGHCRLDFVSDIF